MSLPALFPLVRCCLVSKFCQSAPLGSCPVSVCSVREVACGGFTIASGYYHPVIVDVLSVNSFSLIAFFNESCSLIIALHGIVQDWLMSTTPSRPPTRPHICQPCPVISLIGVCCVASCVPLPPVLLIGSIQTRFGLSLMFGRSTPLLKRAAKMSVPNTR